MSEFDYSQPGAYFVTVCASNRQNVFGKIVDGQMELNELAQTVTCCWNEIPDHYPHVSLDAFVVMPNHVHGILLFHEPVEAGHARPLPAVVGSFKSAVSRQAGYCVWQHRFWDRIQRNEAELNLARHYIDENPFHWPLDKEYLS